MATEEDTSSRWWSKDTVAVVTGSNKGLGFGTVCEFARRGLTVVLTSRDLQKGLAALKSAQELVGTKASECLHFHQLDVTDAQSVTELAAWLQSEFGGIDILINNAAVNFYSTTFEDAVVTVETNYFGVRRITEKLLPLLRPSSHGARIVNVSSRAAAIQSFQNDEHLQGQIEQAVTNLDINLVDSLAGEYLEDERSGRKKEKFATDPFFIIQYRHSKLFANAFTRILAGELSMRPNGQKIFVSGMCPGGLETDMLKGLVERNGEVGRQMMVDAGIKFVSAEEGGKRVLWLALMPEKDYPHGKFFVERAESTW